MLIQELIKNITIKNKDIYGYGNIRKIRCTLLGQHIINYKRSIMDKMTYYIACFLILKLHHQFIFLREYFWIEWPLRIICRRGVNIDSIIYPIYSLTEEASFHLFFSFKVASTIWNMCNTWICIKITYHNQHVHHFYQFNIPNLKKKGDQGWKCMWVAII